MRKKRAQWQQARNPASIGYCGKAKLEIVILVGQLVGSSVFRHLEATSFIKAKLNFMLILTPPNLNPMLIVLPIFIRVLNSLISDLGRSWRS